MMAWSPSRLQPSSHQVAGGVFGLVRQRPPPCGDREKPGQMRASPHHIMSPDQPPFSFFHAYIYMHSPVNLTNPGK
jgi:hypothetical protein